MCHRWPRLTSMRKTPIPGLTNSSKTTSLRSAKSAQTILKMTRSGRSIHHIIPRLSDTWSHLANKTSSTSASRKTPRVAYCHKSPLWCVSSRCSLKVHPLTQLFQVAAAQACRQYLGKRKKTRPWVLWYTSSRVTTTTPWMKTWCCWTSSIRAWILICAQPNRTAKGWCTFRPNGCFKFKRLSNRLFSWLMRWLSLRTLASSSLLCWSAWSNNFKTTWALSRSSTRYCRFSCHCWIRSGKELSTSG